MIKSNIISQLKAVDFFCGAGGASCGFKQAGIDVLGGIDIDQCCQLTYEKNNSAKFLHVDITSLDKKKFGRFFGIRRNQRNIIFIGCSPCQYYTNLKTNKTNSSKTRMLLLDFQEFVEYYRPGYVFIENVPGLEKKEDSPLSNFKAFLIDSGYYFADGVINAKYYGIPQNRQRYVLLATRLKKKIELPEPNKKNVKTVCEAIGDLDTFPPIEAGHLDHTDFKHSSARLSQLNLQRIIVTKHDGGDRKKWSKELQLDCYKKHDGHYDVYGRMFWDRPSPALTTRFVSYSNGRYGHPEQDRAISLREGATLQSFPLDYLFYSSNQGTIAKMIGNAVPPELAKRIGKCIIEHNNSN